MEKIINKAKEHVYTSLEYLEAEDVKDSEIMIDEKEAIFLCSTSKNKAKLEWASSSREHFFSKLNEVLGLLAQNPIVENVSIDFIPEDYTSEMERLGFEITSEWIDFWNEKLLYIPLDVPQNLRIREIMPEEYTVGSLITRSCKDYSRGYKGETPEWIKEWNEDKNSKIFLADLDNEIVGICCVKLYGFESEKGTICWLREVAVEPRYHSKKIGFMLVAFANNWAIENGATRSFLACDADNKKAIKLYEAIEYKRKMGRGQINMQKLLVKPIHR